MNKMILVTNENGKAMTTSLKIAEVFGKTHDNVIKAIRNKINLFVGHVNFNESSYINSQNKEQPMYLLDRDFTTFLIMGFTGSKADEFKLKYIEAFNKMEETIKNGLSDERALSIMAIMNATDDTSKVLALKNFEECVKRPLLEEIAKQKPKCEYHDAVLNKSDLLTTTVIAKDLGFKSAQKLNDILTKNKIIYKRNNVYHPYAEYEWLISEQYCDYQSYGTENANPCLKWTEKGRKWIYENINAWKVSIC